MVRISYIGIDHKKQWFKFNVEVNGHLFDYFCGFGNITNKWGRNIVRLTGTGNWTTNAKILNCIPNEHKHNTKQYLNITDKDFCRSLKVPYYIKFPSEKDVLGSLYCDAIAGRQTFKEFCDNYGYSDDSISAFKVYMICQDIANKLVGFKFPDDIEDY